LLVGEGLLVVCLVLLNAARLLQLCGFNSEKRALLTLFDGCSGEFCRPMRG
jgi:hypothetical protein